MASKTVYDPSLASRTTAFSFDPLDVTVIGVDTLDGPEHPLYDERAFEPLDDAMVKNIMFAGILQPIVVTKDGDAAICVDGRRRVMHAREANRQLAERGDKNRIRIPAMNRKGNEEDLFAVMVATNSIRKDETVLQRAAKASRMHALGCTEEEVALAFGITVQAIERLLRIHSASKPVREAVAAGFISISAAATLTELPRKEQVAAIAEAKESGTRVTEVVAEKRVRAAKGQPEKIQRPSAGVLRKVLKEAEALREAGTSTPYNQGFEAALLFVLGLKTAGDALPWGEASEEK